MSSEVIIVGSGAAAVAAAEALKERDTLILDVGFKAPKAESLDGDLYSLKEQREDLTAEFIGPHSEGLHNVDGRYLNPKLKSPLLRYITRDWRKLSPVRTSSFVGEMSFSQGGLANAWGAGVYRYCEREFNALPIGLSDLAPYYDRLTHLIGVAGCDDDLSPYFGPTEGLLPPVETDSQAKLVLSRYARKREALNTQGIFLGRPRLAVLTEDREDRARYDYRGLEFFQPNIPAVYNPTYTLQELMRRSNVRYLSDRLVIKYEEQDDLVKVYARNLKTEEIESFAAKRLVLAAGALSTTKIVLCSNNDHTSRLPLLDNSVSYIPFLIPRRIGVAQERRFFAGVQLNLVYDGDLCDLPIQGSFYGVGGILRSEIIMDFPLSVRANLTCGKFLAGAIAILQLFYPSSPDDSNYLMLTDGDELQIQCASPQRGRLEARLISAFRKLGCYGALMLCRYPEPGNSFHYAGTLPMRTHPQGRYETDPTGLLCGTRSIYIADGAVFPELCSKNFTFTMMANAMRIGEHVSRSVGT